MADEKQGKIELNSINTPNSLTAIADSYNDSDDDVDHDGISNMEVEQGEVPKGDNNEHVNIVQVSDVQSSALQVKQVTAPRPGDQVLPEAKLSAQNLITSEDEEASSDTTTTTTKIINNNSDINEHLLHDAVYIMSIVGEELKSLDTCVDDGWDQSTGVMDQAKADSSIAISSHDHSDSSDDECSSSSDSSVDELVIRERVAELDDLEEDKAVGTPPKTKDELSLKDLPEEPELEIEVDEDVQLIPIGEVNSIVEVLVVIHALPHTPALDSGSYLFLESREYLGMVFEIFGPVQRPYYSIRFNSERSLGNKNICKGMKVCFAPDVTDYSIFVFTAQLRKIKGSDASWKHDQEPPPEFIEFSDDEEEAQVKAKKKQERKAKRTKETEETGATAKQKQHKVGRWSWRNQQQTPPPPESSAMLHSQGSNQSPDVLRGPAAGPHVPSFIRQRPPFDTTALPGYPRGPPRGPPSAGFIRPSQGPLLCSPIAPPRPGHSVEYAGPFMGNPMYMNRPPFSSVGFGHITSIQGPTENGPPGYGLPRHGPPMMVPYQHEPSGVAPYQHGPFYSGHITPPPHGPPTSGSS